MAVHALWSDMTDTVRKRSPTWLGRIWAETEPRVLAGLALAVGGIWAILLLGGEVREGETGAFDRRILLDLRVPGQPHLPIGPPWLQDVMRDVTALGSSTMVILVTSLAVAALAFHRHRRRAIVLALVMVSAQGCDELLKGLYGRARPDFALIGVYSYAQSFPSGHSSASAALWLSLATIAASFEPTWGRKAFWFVVAVIIVLGVGLSRIYLGVHWPTDVLAGWMLGAGWALGGWLAWRALDVRGGARPAG